MEDNGGVWEELVLGGEFSSFSVVEVFLGDVCICYVYCEVFYIYYYCFGGGQDFIKGMCWVYMIVYKAWF